MQLSPRQARILRAVVREFHATGRPVGSRLLVDTGIVDASSSTVRNELGRLEQLGLLEHPHTSAGRVPTDRGYRHYVDTLGDEELQAESGSRLPLPVDEARTAIDAALRHTTTALAEATELLALVTAPPASGATIRHVEVLQLAPTRIVVVIITATGDVTRHVVTTIHPVDRGLVEWAGQYLNEQVTGMTLGQNLLRTRLQNPDLSPRELGMLALVAPAFTELVESAAEVHVGGSPELFRRLGADVQQVLNLVTVLDERRRLLESLRRAAGRASGPRRVAVSIGVENDLPELQALTVVGASYGLRTRPLGMVGLIGPRSMDYPRAIMAVQAAAGNLSYVVGDLYDAGAM